MELLGFLFVLGLFILSLLLMLGGYVLQRDRYWRRVWENMGRPDVKNISELKEYINNKADSLASSKLKPQHIKSK